MSVLKVLLSILYGMVSGTRRWLYDRGVLATYRSYLPVISVGNITAGGNGKTPLCLLLARELSLRGYRPAILSRGYGGHMRGPHMVCSADTPEMVGDEPVLLAQAGFPVFIARSRVDGIKMIEANGGVDLVILDDGLQHRALHRDLDIVSIFAGSERAVQDFARGELLPVGMFREDRDKALQRASIVVVSHRKVFKRSDVPAVDDRLMRLMPNKDSVFSAYLEPQGVFSMADGAAVEPRAVCAFAAIANPEGFFQSLEVLGFYLVERFPYRDHHLFSEQELLHLLNSRSDTIFVCTAKDAVKIAGFSDAIKSRCGVLRVEARVVPSECFWGKVNAALSSSSSRDIRG